MSLLFISAALAGEVVLYANEDAGTALRRVGAAAKTDPLGLRALTLSEAVAGRPMVTSGAVAVTPCEGMPTRLQSVAESVEKAERAISYVELEAARVQLDAAVRTIGCLGEPLDRKLGARVYYLLAVTHHARENKQAAREAFARALELQPDLEWDAYFPPDAEPLMRQVRLSLTSKEVPVLLIPAATRALLDGDTIEPNAQGHFAVNVGPHLIQFPDAKGTSLLAVDGPATLIAPAATPPSALEWAAEPDQQPALSAILSATFEADTTVYVTLGGRVFLTQVGTPTWDELKVRNGLFARDSEHSPRRTVGLAMFWTGGAGLVASSVVLAISGSQYSRAGDELLQGSLQDSLEASAARKSAGNRLITSMAMAGVCAALTGAGIGMSTSGRVALGPGRLQVSF